MKTFIVLFDVNGFVDSRKMAESIENSKFLIETEFSDDFLTGVDVGKKIIKELGIKENDKEFVTVIPITDFMDMYNNEEVNETGTFMSYVHAEFK